MITSAGGGGEGVVNGWERGHAGVIHRIHEGRRRRWALASNKRPRQCITHSRNHRNERPIIPAVSWRPAGGRRPRVRPSLCQCVRPGQEPGGIYRRSLLSPKALRLTDCPPHPPLPPPTMKNMLRQRVSDLLCSLTRNERRARLRVKNVCVHVVEDGGSCM